MLKDCLFSGDIKLIKELLDKKEVSKALGFVLKHKKRKLIE